MTIKPGMLCWLVGNDVADETQGKVVLALGFIGSFYFVSRSGSGRGRVEDAWSVSAHWLPGGAWVAPTANLRPISDPDTDLSESYPETLQDMLKDSA